jgi:hypothetical protein
VPSARGPWIELVPLGIREPRRTRQTDSDDALPFASFSREGEGAQTPLIVPLADLSEQGEIAVLG